MDYRWVDCDRNTVGRRYDRIAGYIPLLDRLFFLPRDLRRRAVGCIGLSRGDSVLEIGCGTGNSLPFLREAVGPQGHIYAVDISKGMLRRAGERRNANRWHNVDLTECDAGDYTAPKALDGVLFSLSYNTMPHHRSVLRRAWQQLRPGGRLVIMDAKLPSGPAAKLLLPFSLWLMKHTMLGNPLIAPWQELAAVAGGIETTEFLFGSYYICRGTKPLIDANYADHSIAANDDADIDMAHRIAAE